MKFPYRLSTSFIAAAVFVSARSASVMAQSVRSGVDAARGADQPDNLFGDAGIFTDIVNLLLFVIGAVAVIMIIVGAFRYVLSGGDASAVTAAKNTILYAIVGIVVAILAYAIVNFVVNSFAAGGTVGL